MINLDFITLAITLALVSVTSVMVLFIFWRINKSLPGVLHWSVGSFLRDSDWRSTAAALAICTAGNRGEPGPTANVREPGPDSGLDSVYPRLGLWPVSRLLLSVQSSGHANGTGRCADGSAQYVSRQSQDVSRSECGRWGRSESDLEADVIANDGSLVRFIVRVQPDPQ